MDVEHLPLGVLSSTVRNSLVEGLFAKGTERVSLLQNQPRRICFICYDGPQLGETVAMEVVLAEKRGEMGLKRLQGGWEMGRSCCKKRYPKTAFNF